MRRAAGWLERQAGRTETGLTFEPGSGECLERMELGREAMERAPSMDPSIGGGCGTCGCDVGVRPRLLVAGASQRLRPGWGLLRERERCNLSETRGGSSLVRRGEPLASRRLLEKPSNTLLQTSALVSPVLPSLFPQPVPPRAKEGARAPAQCWMFHPQIQ